MTANTEVTSVWNGGAMLGECPVWDADRSVLWWIDCVAPALHAFEPATGETRSRPLEDRVHAIGLRRGGGLIAAMGAGLVRLDPDTGAADLIAQPERHRPNHRFNDGKCGPDGAFWVGSMHRSYGEASGRLYRLDPGGNAYAAVEDLTVPNGLGWSPDGRTFYLGDSPTGAIAVHDFDPELGSVGPRRAVVGSGLAPGWPDGLAVDVEGCLWNARWNGGCVVRFTPDGRVDRRIEMPVSRPTSCAFGGPGLDRLFVTSARIGLDETALGAQPLAGALFTIDPGVAGAPVGRFAG